MVNASTNVASAIREVRELRGLSARELAEWMNRYAGPTGKWTQTKVSAVERGPDPQRAGRAVRVDELVLFAQALDVEVEELMSGELSEQTKQRLAREQAADEAFDRIQLALLDIAAQGVRIRELGIRPSDVLALIERRGPAYAAARGLSDDLRRLDKFAEMQAEGLRDFFTVLDEVVARRAEETS